ncbi:MAG TPA: TPM domain-containing protein [Ohtaekwangia sp.]|nr:TPM domain-containing protein [Ohtaekwangia sp.]
MNKVLFFFFCLIVQTGFAQRAVPPLWGHSVHDEAHVLSASAIDALEVMLKQHEDSTSNQIAVLIIPSLDGEVLEEFSLRVAHDEWKLGQKDKDNGVLLLIAVEDRKMRIEVGEGLEGVLPDVITSRIIRNEIAPHFRSQNYEQGVTAGVDAIIQAIGGEYVQDQDGAGLGEVSAELSWKEKLLMGAFVFGILGIFTLLGLFIPGCGGWALYAFLIPFYATFPMVIFGVDGGLYALGTYMISFPLLKVILGKTAWGKRMIKKMGTTRSGSGKSTGSGWFVGGSSGSGWSSGGGGGFSGGGGSFGGGGSSGSW